MFSVLVRFSTDAVDGGATCSHRVQRWSVEPVNVSNVDKVEWNNRFERFGQQKGRGEERDCGSVILFIEPGGEKETRKKRTRSEWEQRLYMVLNYTWRRLHYHNRGTYRSGILNRILYDRVANAKNKSRPYARYPRRAEFLTNVTRTIERYEAEGGNKNRGIMHFSLKWTRNLALNFFFFLR